MDVREKLVDVHSKLMGLLQRAPYIRCEDVHRQYAVNWLMNNGVTVQEWVSVKDRLPSKCGMACLLVGVNCFGQRKVFQGFTGYMENGKLEWHTNIKGMDITVWTITHWMPLPQPPKGE